MTNSERAQLLGQKGATIWLTGLSASGKVRTLVLDLKLIIETWLVDYRVCSGAAPFASTQICLPT